MPIYTGRITDGSDMKEVEGMHVNPDNPDEWSNKPYPSQIKWISRNKRIIDHMNGKYCLNDVYQQIKNKTCKLSKMDRDFVLSCFDNDGNFMNEL